MNCILDVMYNDNNIMQVDESILEIESLIADVEINLDEPLS